MSRNDDMNTIQILLLDDEAIILSGHKSLLESVCNYLKTALCAKQASELLKKEMPDCLISALIMPKMDGINICRKIKVRYPNIETILVSGSPDEIKKHLLDFLHSGGREESHV